VVVPGGEVPSVFNPGSPEAHAIADLFGVTLLICAAIFGVVCGLMVYSMVRFRGREGDAEPRQIAGHTRLEMAWTAVPLVIVAGLLALTFRTMGVVDPPADRAPDLVVVGHQWWWEVRYPSKVAGAAQPGGQVGGGDTVTANEIHVPVGRKLLVQIEATDVIHDFWVPELARKVDAVPGHPNHVWMEVTAPGTYLGACAEYCGAQHAWMRLKVIAQPAAEFDAWLAHEATPAPLAGGAVDVGGAAGAVATGGAGGDAVARGARIFQERTCIDCHAVQGLAGGGVLVAGLDGRSGVRGPARVAPDLTHLASRTTLAAGAAKNTPGELARWLANPDAIKPGSHMPNLHLSEAQVNDLVAYFETLR
jgi:cytochrome c oxidase subunit 2